MYWVLHYTDVQYIALVFSVCCNTLRGVGWLGGDQGQGERRCEWCTAPLVQTAVWWYRRRQCNGGTPVQEWYRLQHWYRSGKWYSEWCITAVVQEHS